MWARIADWLHMWFQSPEEQFLSASLDLADFERRQRLIEQSRDRFIAHNFWY